MYVEAREVPIREVLLKYSSIEKEEKEKDGFKCCCPVHSDNTPSFKVYNDNTFYCFGCGIAGGPLDLVRMIKHLATNEEAESLLEKEFDIEEDSIPTVEGLCERKGLDVRVANGMMGWQDTENRRINAILWNASRTAGNSIPYVQGKNQLHRKEGSP